MFGAAAIATTALLSPRPRLLSIRCALALLVLAPWALYSSMAVLHMPGYFLFHHLWVWFLVFVMLVAALGSLVRRAVVAIKVRRANAI